jgi:DNA polymerase III subunit beta
MRVSCLQENLAKGLSIVGRAVATRSTLPVLSNILLATDQGRLRLSATNLEIGITCWIGAKVEEDGATTVPARTFVDLVSALPAERVDMELVVRTQTLNLKCGRFENNIRGIDATEFPLIPSADDNNAIRIDPDSLRTAINQVVFAAATDESRPILTGVLVKFENDPSGQGRATFAAADGFRLAVRTAPLIEPVSSPVSVIIPARALAELGRVSGEQENPVIINITPSKSQVLFHLDNIDLVSQLIDGNFPDYNQIIPKKKETRTVVGTAELLKASKAANVFARESANIVKLTIEPGSEIAPGHITVQATSAETGDNVGEMDATVDGIPIQIAFNVKYLIDMLSVANAAQVALETSTPSSPGKFVPVGDDSFLCVVMPMHIGNR